MVDVTKNADDRAQLTRLVYARLKDPKFRKSLTVGSDGSRPVVAALLSDLMIDLVQRATDSGGMINAVVPYRNGALVFTIRAEAGNEPTASNTSRLKNDCTVGLLLARVGLTDETAFHFVVGSDDRRKSGEAELVGIA